MEFVVYSHRHELVPFSLRLKDSYLLVKKEAYEAALAGKVKLALRNNGEITEETLGVIQDRLATGEVTLLTNVKKHSFSGGRILGVRDFPEAPVGPLRLGGWLDGGRARGLHLLVPDEGVWPGGLGPNRLGGLTLVLPRVEPDLGEFLRPVLEILGDFTGLFQVGIALDEETGGLRPKGLLAGWPWLQTEAFVSELENFAGVCAGEEPVFTAGRRFVVVVPVSVPPWPNQGRSKVTKIEGLTPAYTGKFWWFDCAVRGNQLYTAGLDGMVGVARGAAGNLELARAIALELAGSVRVPEVQYRPDVGEKVNLILASLERQYGVLI